MMNYECLREKPQYQRDIYHDLQRIEERGKRMKENRKNAISTLFRSWKKNKARRPVEHP
jgi:hypothetical protein